MFKLFENIAHSTLSTLLGFVSVKPLLTIVTEMKHDTVFFIKLNLFYSRNITPKRVMSFAGPNSASLSPRETALFEEMSQWWRAVGNTVFDSSGPRFEPHTSRSIDVHVTARQTGRLI